RRGLRRGQLQGAVRIDRARPGAPRRTGDGDGVNMKIDRIHHVAYRCRDAKQTVLWYRQMLHMDFVLAIAEDRVPSTKAPDPYMHVFLDAGSGNVLAFFEFPPQPPMG